jgi:hypothetical protein
MLLLLCAPCVCACADRPWCLCTAGELRCRTHGSQGWLVPVLPTAGRWLLRAPTATTLSPTRYLVLLCPQFAWCSKDTVNTAREFRDIAQKRGVASALGAHDTVGADGMGSSHPLSGPQAAHLRGDLEKSRNSDVRDLLNYGLGACARVRAAVVRRRWCGSGSWCIAERCLLCCCLRNRHPQCGYAASRPQPYGAAVFCGSHQGTERNPSLLLFFWGGGGGGFPLPVPW